MTNHPAIKNVTFTPAIQHTTQLDWPNGKGYTPCTAEYKEKHDRVFELNTKAHTDPDGLTDEEYNEVRSLENDMGSMQLNGHLGKSVRY